MESQTSQKEAPPVAQLLEYLEKMTLGLEKRIDVLRVKLSPVLPQKPKSEESKALGMIVSKGNSVLAEKLHQILHSLQNSVVQLDDICGSLEI